MNKTITPKPLLKWAGGKRQLLPELRKRLPDEYDIYYEPFLGGGALLFDICPNKAVVNDLNMELYNVYSVVKEFPSELCALLAVHQENHSRDYYYHIRNMDRLDEYSTLSRVEKAARIIYLNRTCYNGLYRVNKNGYYNTPIGRYKSPKILDEENIQAIYSYFTNAEVELLNSSYQNAVDNAKEGDFVYFDPPYDKCPEEMAFIDYTKDGFDRTEQSNLKNVCDRLTRKNVKWMLSNSDTVFIRELYSEYIIEEVSAKRMINSKGASRNSVSELIIRNYK